MTTQDKGLLLHRIISGIAIVELDNKTYTIRPVSPEHRYLAEVVSKKVYDEAVEEGLIVDTETILIDNEIWTEKMDSDYEKLPNDIEELSVMIYNAKRLDEREMYRNNLRRFKVRQDELNMIRHSLDHMTADGLANMARFKFLLGCSIYINGRPFWQDPMKDYKASKKNVIIEKIMLLIGKLRPSQNDYRDIALSDVWLSLWRNAKLAGKGIFNCSTAEMTDEQRALCSWAHLYDNIWGDPNHPPDYIINDHECLDGWLVLRKRNQLEEDLKKKYDLDNPKFANADEIYFTAHDEETHREICKLNSEAGKSIKQQRFETIRKKGIARDADFADNAQKLAIARAKGPS